MNKYKKMFIIFLVAFIIGVCGFTSSFLMYLKADSTNKEEKDPEKVIVGDIVFTSIDNSVYLENAMPTLDKFGVEGKGFSFSITNTTNGSKKYQLRLADDNSTITNNVIRYQLIKNDTSLGIYTLSSDGIIEKNTINSNETINYTIKIWLDYNSDVKVGRLSKKIAIDEIYENEEKSVVNKPILTSGMIPAYYDNDTNSWHKSDSMNSDNKWYSYEEAKWANAITVESEKREYYINSEVGTKIEPEDINSMWVWIPRFNYINDNITFVNENEKAYQAFTFNDTELTGIWFSKFESGMKEDSECNSSSLTKKCNNSNNKLYFVPNYPFTTKITMANLFYAIRKMELKNNIYGFNGTGTKLNNDGTISNDNNDIDIHMIKNSEWQAVILLSSSKYGKMVNNKTDDKIINNNSNYTGKASYEENNYDYNVLNKGELASTTGNVYGVYDMAGGKREYVMVEREESSIFNKKSNSGFTTLVKNYYYDNELDSSTLETKNKYESNSLINNEPLTRGGYKNNGNIYTIYGANDYLDKISVETNSRASLVIIKGE